MPEVKVMLPGFVIRGAACWAANSGPRILDRTARTMLSSDRLTTGP
jgi:hypothetical protein